MSDSQLLHEIEEIVRFGRENGVNAEFTPNEVKHVSLNFVYKLFPEDCGLEESYLANGDEDEIKVKYVMMHCLLEFWYQFNRPEVDHRKFVFEKVMRGKEQGWVGCENASDDLDPSVNPIGNIDYFMKFEKGMFDCVGI